MTDQDQRMPTITIRNRYGRKMLRHGLRLGWRVKGPVFPVEKTLLPPCECPCYLCLEEAETDG